MNLILDIIGVMGGIIGIIAAIYGTLTYFASHQVKSYAAARDFAHLQQSFEQLSQGIDSLYKEIDLNFESTNEKLIEIKAHLIWLRRGHGGTSD